MTDLPNYPGGGDPEPNQGSQGGTQPPWAQGAYPGDPEPFPGTSYSDGPPPRPPVPQTVRNAVKLMYVGAALALIVGLAAASGNLEHVYRQIYPHASAATIRTDAHRGRVSDIIAAFVGAGLWMWMAWKNRAGANWARILSTVFFAISTFELLFGLAAGGSTVGRVIQLVEWLVGLAIIVLLWRKESSAYFRPAKAW